MLKCSDCNNYLRTVGGQAYCSLKSRSVEANCRQLYIVRDESISCVKERTASKGFLGFFKDETRCGPDGKNFEPKES